MDVATAESAKEELLRQSETFRELVSKHETYEQRLSELSTLNYPNEDEQIEEVKIKKKKLSIKDEIYAMISDFDQSH